MLQSWLERKSFCNEIEMEPETANSKKILFLKHLSQNDYQDYYLPSKILQCAFSTLKYH